MSEAKFTKGPWGCVTHDGHVKHAAIYVDGGGFDISNCPDAIANAHLIATAPEMYAEIERDVLEIEARLKFADKRTLAVNPDVANLKRKKALLAKARGEQDD